MAHTRCMMDKQGYVHACSCTRPRARPHAEIYNTAFFRQRSLTRLSVTLYVNCLVLLFPSLRNAVYNRLNGFSSRIEMGRNSCKGQRACVYDRTKLGVLTALES
jgi:hypothetical protein